MRHLVITIGCEYGAKGNAIGRKIAEDLNIKFYNRDLVDEIIEEVGIPKEIMEKVDQGKSGETGSDEETQHIEGAFCAHVPLHEDAVCNV